MCVPVYTVSTKCWLQTAADYCFHHANDNVTTIVPFFSNPENNGLQSVFSLHFVLSTNLHIKDQQDMNIFIFSKYH